MGRVDEFWLYFSVCLELHPFDPASNGAFLGDGNEAAIANEFRDAFRRFFFFFFQACIIDRFIDRHLERAMSSCPFLLLFSLFK